MTPRCWCGLPIEDGEPRIYRHIVTPTSSAWHHIANQAHPFSDPGDPFTARPEVPLRAGVRLDGSPGLRELASRSARTAGE